MLRSVRCLLLVASGVATTLLVSCNGARNPNGTPTTPATAQALASQGSGSGSGSGGGTPMALGLQATEAVLQDALAQINEARSSLGLKAVARDKTLDQCALSDAIQLSSNGQADKACGQRDSSTGVGPGDQQTSFRTFVTEIMNEGMPPAGTRNAYSNLTDPTITTVGIGIFTTNQNYMVILYK